MMSTTLTRADALATPQAARISARRKVLLVSACALAVYLAIQIAVGEHMAIRSMHDFQSFARRYGPRAYRDDPGLAALLKPSWVPLWLRGWIFPSLLWGVGEFLAMAAAALAIAAGRDRRRRLFAVPALAWTLLPAVFLYSPAAILRDGGSFGGVETRQPFQAGLPWGWPPYGHRLMINLGVAACLLLALTPATALVISRGRPFRTRTGPQAAAIRTSAYGTIAVLTVVLLFALWVYARAYTSQPAYPWTAAVPVFVPLFVLGLLTDVRRPSLVTAGVLAGGVVALDWLARIESGSAGWTSSGVAVTSITFAVPLALGLAWRPLATGLAWLAERPMVCLIALNGLNVADAVLTRFALHSEQAVEANPIIRVGGIPMKIAGVALFSWLLYRVMPRALVWPVMAFVAVIAWHVVGYVVSTHLV